MNIDDIKIYLDSLQPLLNADNVVSVREAEVRSGKFLDAQYRISGALLELSSQFIKLSSLKDITYAQVMASDVSKNATAMTANVKAHPDYVKVREQYDEIESQIEYFKTVGKVYENAHVFYRKRAFEGEFRA